jgi:RNA-directed DNA polymerase
MTLDGLEKAVLQNTPRRTRVNFIRYADDFIITGKSKLLLKNNIIPTVEEFFSKRGLHLSHEKTKITYIKDGFDFLGQHVRKHGRKLLITPSKRSVQSLIHNVGTTIRKHVSSPMEKLIVKLNAILRGWANYHRHVVSSDTFQHVDTYIYEQLWRMLHKRHPAKSKRWLIHKYWTATGKKWLFAITRKFKEKTHVLHVLKIGSIEIKRYIKIKADANPYLREYRRYFWERRHAKDAKLRSQASACKAEHILNKKKLNCRVIPEGLL